MQLVHAYTSGAIDPYAAAPKIGPLLSICAAGGVQTGLTETYILEGAQPARSIREV